MDKRDDYICSHYSAGSELLIIASAAHFSNVEQPEVFNQAMLGFLDKHAGRGSAA